MKTIESGDTVMMPEFHSDRPFRVISKGAARGTGLLSLEVRLILPGGKLGFRTGGVIKHFVLVSKAGR